MSEEERVKKQKVREKGEEEHEDEWERMNKIRRKRREKWVKGTTRNEAEKVKGKIKEFFIGIKD